MTALLRDVRPFLRLHFLVAAQCLGLLSALADRPAKVSELAERLGVQRVDVLETFLEVGVGLGELARRGASYRLRGRRAVAMAGPAGDVPSALAEELVLYHGLVYWDLPVIARGAAARDYLAEFGSVVARSSRVFEPFVAAWVREALRGRPGPTLLDVGCGSGAYLRVAAQASPDAAGIGIELRPEVAAVARENLERWGIADRFEVAQGDARVVLGRLGRWFDVALVANNVYYFNADERVELFARVGAVLAPGGTLLVVSLFKGTSLPTRDLDLVLAASPGCHELPPVGAVVDELGQAGLVATSVRRLVPFESVYVVTATCGDRT